MYNYDGRELKEEGNTQVYLVAYLNHKGEKETEIMIPETYKIENRALERVREVRGGGDASVYADKCTVSLTSDKKSDSAEDIHVVLFRNHEDKNIAMAQLQTPEIFKSRLAAHARKIEVNEDESSLEAAVYPIELYNDKENLADSQAALPAVT